MLCRRGGRTPTVVRAIIDITDLVWSYWLLKIGFSIVASSLLSNCFSVLAHVLYCHCYTDSMLICFLPNESMCDQVLFRMDPHATSSHRMHSRCLSSFISLHNPCGPGKRRHRRRSSPRGSCCGRRGAQRGLLLLMMYAFPISIPCLFISYIGFEC